MHSLYSSAPCFASGKRPKGFRGVTVSKQHVFVPVQRKTTFISFIKELMKPFPGNLMLLMLYLWAVPVMIEVSLRGSGAAHPKILSPRWELKLKSTWKSFFCLEQITKNWFHSCTVQTWGKIILGEVVEGSPGWNCCLLCSREPVQSRTIASATSRRSCWSSWSLQNA